MISTIKYAIISILAAALITFFVARSLGAPISRESKPSSSTVSASAARVVSLGISPAAIKLDGPLASQILVVTATMTDGARRDVTDRCTFTSSKPTVIAISRRPEVWAKADGRVTIVAQFAGKNAKLDVAATHARQPIAYSFVDDVVPILSRLGCSQGSCHGAAQGKGGFRMSLRGYAPEIDFASITRQLGGRRINREDPENSLFLRKPLMEVAHRGGKRLDRGTREYDTLLGWLREGAPGPTGKEAPLAALQILPGDRQMTPGETQHLLVRATFADGRTQDVTNRAIFASNDVAIATVDENGLVKMERAGETAVTAKYMDKLAAVRMMSPFAQKVNPAAFVPANNYIDTLVNAKLKQIHVEPSPLCTDQEFLRRAYIDAIGTLPTPDEAKKFLDDTDPKKRSVLIDALVKRPEYGMVWALKFGDLMVLRREYMHRKYAMVMQQWMADQFNADRPWDQIVLDILTASGDLETHQAGYFYVSRTPSKPGQGFWVRAAEPTAEMVAQIFLGTRIQCAKCHNHPTERYTQDDYYHFTALWQQVGGKGKDDDGVPETLTADNKDDIHQPRTGEVMVPRPLDRSALGFAKDDDRRIKAAKWIVTQDEFVRAIVNRYWARCFGMGIVEPVDDIRSTNPAKNEPLMRALCDDLRTHNFDLKYLLTTIMKSRTYQLSAVPTRTNKIDTKLFSHYSARRLPAEELADAVAQVTGVADKYNGLGLGDRAVELADTEIPSLMLDTFGRPPRVQPSDSERTCSPAINQALALLNGDALQDKLKSGDCVITGMLKSNTTDEQILDSLYLSAFSRHPSSAETAGLLKDIKVAPTRTEGFQDALWAILNSKEFLFDH